MYTVNGYAILRLYCSVPWSVLWSFAVFLMVNLSANAEERDFDCARGNALDSTQGAQLLNKLQLSYGKLQSFSASFTQSAYLHALESSELSNGRVAFLKPGKMRWDYDEPSKQVFLTDGATLWFYQEQQNQVIVDALKSRISGDIPVSFLMGIGELSAEFKLEGSCQVPEGGVLELLPKRADPSLKKLKILVDNNTFLLKGAQVIDLSDNINSFSFGEYKERNSINPKIFKADFPSSADLIDQRPLQD